MAYPPGISLAVIQAGKAGTFFGDAASLTATVTPVLSGTKYLVHQSTGDLMVPSPMTFTAANDSVLSFSVPHVDQAGYMDDNATPYTMWAYKVDVTVLIGNGRQVKKHTWTKNFQPLVGQDFIDIDQIASGTISEPLSAPLPEILSVNGQTGHVTVESGGAEDADIAAFVNDPASTTRTLLDDTYASASKVTLETAARRKAIRNASPTPLSDTIKVTLPTVGGLSNGGFGWQSAPINIYGVNGSYTTDFDPEGVYPLPQGTTYYVDTVNGAQANDGLTPATAKSNMQFAYNVASSGDTIMILDKGPIYRSGGWQDTKIAKSIRIKAANPGVVLAAADNLSYTLSSGATYRYQAVRSNVNKVVDMGLAWAPDGYAYKQVNSTAEVEATPASWFNDGTNVHVRTIDGTKPDSKRILALLNAQHFYVESSGVGDMHVYMEGIRVLGGSHGMLVDAHTHKVSFYAKNCAFAHSASLGEASANGASFAGATNVYMRNVRTLGSKKDGFNYTANNIAGTVKDAPRAIEVECEAYEHGLTGAYSDTCNASTAHAGAKVIRVNCKGHHTRGAVFADVQTGTQSVNYGVTGWDSLSSTDGSNSIFHAQQAGADMWLYGCEAFGAAWDVFANTGTWVGVSDSIYATTNGGGTITAV